MKSVEFAQINTTTGEHIDICNLNIGDIILFADTYTSGLSHAGIYLGQNKFIHAENTTNGVIVTDLSDSYYMRRFVTGVRIVDSVQPTIDNISNNNSGNLSIQKNDYHTETELKIRSAPKHTPNQFQISTPSFFAISSGVSPASFAFAIIAPTLLTLRVLGFGFTIASFFASNVVIAFL